MEEIFLFSMDNTIFNNNLVARFAISTSNEGTDSAASIANKFSVLSLSIYMKKKSREYL